METPANKLDAHTSDTSPARTIPEHTKHTSGYCGLCSCEAERCKGKPATYKSLYDMLGRMQYILANDAEKHVECNEPMYDALREGNEEFYGNISLKDLMEDYGFSPSTEAMASLAPSILDSTPNEIESDKITERLLEEFYEFVGNQDWPEIYQTYIVDRDSFEILKDYGQTVWYNEEMGLHFWGVHHYGTAWSHVMNSVYPVRNAERYEKY